MAQPDTNPRRLELEGPIDRWDEALPLGNGLMGGLLWGGDGEIRLSLDRGDLWDLREHPMFADGSFTYETAVSMAREGRTDEMNQKYDHKSFFPTKLPGARLVISMGRDAGGTSFRLDMEKGTEERTVSYGRLTLVGMNRNLSADACYGFPCPHGNSFVRGQRQLTVAHMQIDLSVKQEIRFRWCPGITSQNGQDKAVARHIDGQEYRIARFRLDETTDGPFTYHFAIGCESGNIVSVHCLDVSIIQ